MRYLILALSFWTISAFAVEPQIGGEGESCYFVKVIDGKTTSLPLKRQQTKDNDASSAYEDIRYNALENNFVSGPFATLAHHWGSPRLIGDVSHEVVFAVRLGGPWPIDDAGLFIYTPQGLAKMNKEYGVKDLPRAQYLAEAWAAFAQSESFQKLSNQEKERRIFNFLAKEFPNGVIAEDVDPANPQNRVFISCQTLY